MDKDFMLILKVLFWKAKRLLFLKIIYAELLAYWLESLLKPQVTLGRIFIKEMFKEY